MGGYNQIQDYNSDTKHGVSPAKNILVFSLFALLLVFGTIIFLYRYIKGVQRAEANKPLFPEENIVKEEPEVSYRTRLYLRLAQFNKELDDIRYKGNQARIKSETAQREYADMERFYKARIKTRSLDNSLRLRPDLKEYYKGKPMTKKRLKESEQAAQKTKDEYLDYEKQLKTVQYNIVRSKAKLSDLK